MAKVNLGDRVKDPITNFQGIAWCRNSYMTGCDRIEVMKEKTEKVNGQENTVIMVFDEPQLKIIKRIAKSIKATPKEKKNGGPKNFLPTSQK